MFIFNDPIVCPLLEKQNKIEITSLIETVRIEITLCLSQPKEK